MRKKPVVLVGVAIAVATVTCVSIRALLPPVSLSKLEAVKPGMTQSQVREILGPPTLAAGCLTITAHGKDVGRIGPLWMYHRFLTFGYVSVRFDTNSSVERAYYERF